MTLIRSLMSGFVALALFVAGVDVAADDMRESQEIIAHRAAFHRLHTAVRVGDPRAVEAALAAGADVNRSSALELAVLIEQTDMVDLLIERGADINRAGPSGDLPLAVAARRGRLEMMQQLIDKGADPRLRDRRGLSAMDHAQRHGHTEAVRLLQRRDPRNSSATR